MDECVVVLEGRGLDLEGRGLDLEGRGLDLEGRGLDLEGRGLDLEVTGGTFGNVVFRAGHPEDSASRRTGQ